MTQRFADLEQRSDGSRAFTGKDVGTQHANRCCDAVTQHHGFRGSSIT